MKRSRSEEQIIRILKEHEAGVPVTDLCRKHGISDASIYKWKSSSARWRSRRPSVWITSARDATPWFGAVTGLMSVFTILPAESEAKRPAIPTEGGERFRSKAATQSERRRPPC